MICRLSTKEERREMRLKFYKDDVFVIAQKAIKDMPCSLSLEELFCSAERLAYHLLKNEITDEGLIDFEADDFEEECDDGNVAFLVLGIAFVKLCALRKANPVAGEVAKALVHRCQKYDGFTELLGELDKSEQKRIVDKGRIDLLNYELKTIGNGTPDAGEINAFVNSTLECSVKVIEDVMVAFSNFNAEHGHIYQMQMDVLAQGYRDKQSGKEVKKIEFIFNNPIGTVVAHADRVTSGNNHE